MKPRRYGVGGSRTSFWFTIGFVVLFLGIVTPWRKFPAFWGRLAARGAVIPPRPSSVVFVNDFAGVIDDPTRQRIASLLAAHEAATSNEVVVVTVQSLRGLTRQDFANRLFNAWGLGKKGKDNGVLLLVATGDREARFEVGYGLEPVLTDGMCGEITRQEMIPYFKRGDYPGGILAGITRTVALLSGTGPARVPPGPEAGSGNIRDTAGVINGEARANVLHYIRLLREKAKVEFGVVTQPSLLGISAEETAGHWVSALGLDKRGGDRWVVLLVVRDRATAYLVAGPGVRGDLLPESAALIVRTEFEPANRDGNVGGALWSTSAAVWKAVGERPVAGVSAMGLPAMAGMTAFIALFIGIGAFMCGAGFGTLRVFPILFGSFFGGMPLFAFSVPFLLGAPLGAPFFLFHVVLAVALFVIGLRAGRRNPAMFGTVGGGSHSGWSWGGGGGGGGGFGGCGGGGGFGGGSSGGGGGGGSW